MAKTKTRNENTDLQLRHTSTLVAISAFNTRTKLILHTKQASTVLPSMWNLIKTWHSVKLEKNTEVCQAQNMMAKCVRASSLKTGHHNHAEHTNIKQRTLTYS